MKNRIKVLSALLLLIMFVVSLNGCSNLSGPSDAEVLKAIDDTGLFSGGVEKFSLKAPIVIVDKSLLSRDGAWQVKVKMVYTYTMAGGHETKPTVKTQSFNISRSKDNSGNTVWKAIAGSK